MIIDQASGSYFDKIYEVKKYLDLAGEITKLLPEITAKEGTRTYSVLLQNDRELRPSGGFMGSYAKLKFKNGGLAEVIFQDIYVPDGQIAGYVEPPWPVQEAFKQGWWKLRDSNWDPDFPKAAKVIDWLFQKGNEEKASGLIAVNFSLVQKLLKILGPFYLPDYNQTVDENNLYQIAQSYSETDFFPGSTQKKDVISGLGKAMLARLKDLRTKEILKIIPLLYQNLEERQILLAFENRSLAAFFQKTGWDGSMKSLGSSTESTINDYLYLVETNLGANKANCCLERKVTQEVDLSDTNILKEKVTIGFKNTGKYQEGRPPFFWGGTYVNFLRIYFPLAASLMKVSVGGQPVSQKQMLFEKKEEQGLRGVGFFVRIPTQTEKTVEITYEVPVLSPGNQVNYHLILQKQPGIESFPYSLLVKAQNNYQKIDKDIRRDEEISINLTGQQ